MSDSEPELNAQIKHLTGLLQARFFAIENSQSTPSDLHWGQFIVEGKPGSQVGVYGSASAVFVLTLDRADKVSEEAKSTFERYVSSPESEPELAHNIKLALVCLALAPSPNVKASEKLQSLLEQLLGRWRTAEGLWTPYTSPSIFANTNFKESPSDVASALIAILLNEIHRRLSHETHAQLRGQIESVLRTTAGKLENSFVSKKTSAVRHASLIATAIVLLKGKAARRSVKAAFHEAVQKRDFADRRVFFYDCIRGAGSPSRDYFILPGAILLPMAAEAKNASAMQIALSLEVASELVEKLDDYGVFKGGQELPSTVEQGLTALALGAAARAAQKRGKLVQTMSTWLYVTQSSPSGVPTKLVYGLIFALWCLTFTAVMGEYLPASLRNVPVLTQIYKTASTAPEAAAQFLAFVTAALPASRSIFLRLIGRG